MSHSSPQFLRRASSALVLSIISVMGLGGCASEVRNARGVVVPQAQYQPAEASNPYTQTAWRMIRWDRADRVPVAIGVPGGGTEIGASATGESGGRITPGTSTRKSSAQRKAQSSKQTGGRDTQAAIPRLDIGIRFHQRPGSRVVDGVVACSPFRGDYTVANGLVILTGPTAPPAIACGNPTVDALGQAFLTGLANLRGSSLDDYANPRMLALVFPNGDVLHFVRDVTVVTPDGEASQPMGPRPVMERQPAMGPQPVQLR